jgi:hypothetical protein
MQVESTSIRHHYEGEATKSRDDPAGRDHFLQQHKDGERSEPTRSQFSRQCLSIFIAPPGPCIIVLPPPAAAPGARAPIAAIGYSTSTVPAVEFQRGLDRLALFERVFEVNQHDMEAMSALPPKADVRRPPSRCPPRATKRHFSPGFDDVVYRGWGKLRDAGAS